MRRKIQHHCRRLNQQGSTLEIVLIIFLILMTTIITYGMYMKESYQLYRYEKVMNQERQIEVLLRSYYRQKADEGDLSSGRIIADHQQIRYKVKDEEEYYRITSSIHLDDVSYDVDMEMDKKSLNVTRFEYL